MMIRSEFLHWLYVIIFVPPCPAESVVGSVPHSAVIVTLNCYKSMLPDILPRLCPCAFLWIDVPSMAGAAYRVSPIYLVAIHVKGESLLVADYYPAVLIYCHRRMDLERQIITAFFHSLIHRETCVALLWRIVWLLRWLHSLKRIEHLLLRRGLLILRSRSRA